MAIAKTKLEYISLSTGNWVQAVNTNGQDAVVMMTVEQSINASAKADIILSNRSIDPTSDGTPAKGPLTDVFAEFQRIRLIHQEIGIPIFSGRIYRVRDIYDAQYGQTIRVVAFDSLKEFKEYPIEDGADSLESVDTTDSDEGGYDLRKRSQVIKYMLDELKLKDTNLLTTDTNQFEDSWSTDSLGDKKLDLTKLDRNVAGVIHDLAIADPVKNSSATAIGESGYDYRVEPRFLSNAANHKPIDSLHYFMRGTRPGKGGAYGASAAPVLTTTATDSLTIEYTNSSSPADSGLKQTMMPTYEFDKPKGELITSVICHYTDEGKEDESNADESPGRTEGVVTFELFKGSALSGTFTWAGKALDVNKPGVINVPELLNITDGISSACRVQWQNTDSNYLLVSNISPNFPTADEDITLTGATSGATFVMNPATARMSVKYGVQRPFRIQRPLSSDLGIIRDEVVSRLVGRTDLVITRGKFQTVKYPIVYHELVNTATPPASTTSRSGNTITWTGAIAAQTQGVRLGHIIAEMDTVGGYTRYAWISAITNDRSINYGATATDTSDGTALDASKILRIIIPLRPGDVIRVKNAQSGVNTDQVILSLGYDESPGMFSARYETVGSNNKFNNIYEEGEELRTTIAAITPKKFPDPKSFGETSFFFDGFINRGVNPSSTNDYRQIHWTNAASDVSGTAGKLTMGDGAKFTIACANSATLTTAEHTIFFRPLKARATANKSDTTFQIVLTTSYTKDSDDILVGWCFASDNKAGAKAVLVLAPQFSSKNLFAAGQNGTLTEALLSKSAQEYSSGLEITPVTSGFDSPNTRFQQVTWAACTSAEERLTFGDGDYWSIAAKSGSNYSVTTNGSTYANITALAASSTYYVFIDTADTASGGTLTLRFTTNYSHISTASDGTFSSSKVIMGQIAVPANGDNGAAPRIFPFNNRSLTINAASIAAESITATHITASTIGVDKLTVAAQTSISEKSRSHVGSSAPSSPRTNDIWFDTGPNPTVIKVYDGSGWVVRNSNDVNTTGGTIFSAPIGSPPTANAIYDLWMTTDTDQLYIALSATANEIASNEWVLKNDADAINYAGTSINGGLIKTQRIKLLDGGSLNSTANAFETTISAPIDTGRNTAVAIGSSGVSAGDLTENITIEAHGGGSDLQIYAGDVVRVGTTSTYEDMYVQSGSATTMTVVRGWNDTTVRAFNSGSDIKRYNYSITALTNPHIILDNAGITGYSDAYTPQFSMSSTDGRGYFGAGAITLGDEGIQFDYSGQGNTNAIRWAHATTSGNSLDTFTWLYRANAGSSSNTVVSNGKHLVLIDSTAGNDPAGCALISYVDFGMPYPTSIPHVYTDELIARSITGLCITDSYTGSSSSTAASRTALVTGLANHAHSYASTGHGHSGYSTTSHGHSGYSSTSHNHAGVYDNYEWWKFRTDSGSQHDEEVEGGTLTHFLGGEGISVTNSGHVITITASGGGSSYTHPDPIRLGNGGGSAPAYSFSGSTNTGMWVDGGGLNFNRFGNQVLSLSSTYSYNLKKVYIADCPNISSGGSYVKIDGGTLKTYTSSQRAKMDIQSIVLDSSKIYDLEARSFRFRAQQINEDESSTMDEDGTLYYTDVPAEGEDSPLQFGMIAEEVYEHLPELVSLNKNTNQPIGIDYPLLSVLLLEEMKKLKARIEVLEGNAV